MAVNMANLHNMTPVVLRKSSRTFVAIHEDNYEADDIIYFSTWAPANGCAIINTCILRKGAFAEIKVALK